MSHLELMRMAETEALRSVCKRAQVGAALPIGRRVFCGTNYVRGDAGACCEGADGKTLPTVLHAEEVAIIAANENRADLTGATLYVTRQPCLSCAKLIVESGIKQVYYRDADDKNEGLQWLDDHGVSFDSRWKDGQIQDRYYKGLEGRG